LRPVNPFNRVDMQFIALTEDTQHAI